MNPNQKYFNVLGITPTTDKSVIKKAYRKLAFQYHPDKNPSPQAQSKFIEITDAYEIVTGVKKQPNSSADSESNSPTKEERVKAARERYQKAKLRELEEEAVFYLKLISGKKWKLIKIFGILGGLLSSLLILDYYLPSTVDSSLIGEIYIENSFNHIHLVIESTTYYFKYDEAIQITQYPMIDIVKTPIFNDLKHISVLDRTGVRIKIESAFSLMYLFPIVPIILLIPLVTIWYKRPNPLFTLLHMVSLYLIPIVFCFSIFSNWRIFQIFM